MKLIRPHLVLIPLALVICSSCRVQAGVTRVEITSRADVFDGKPFGPVGPYERIIGKVFFAVDPANIHNKVIVDIDKAPRNAQGLVEFSADLYVLAPKDPSRGNGVALFEVPNRGRRILLSFFNRAPRGETSSAEAEFGDGFLMRQGYTLVAVGWQFSVPRRNGLLGFDAPIAIEQGHPVIGPVTTAFTPDKPSPTYPLDLDAAHYAPVDVASSEARLTVVENVFGTPRVIPRDHWQFARMAGGQVTPDPTTLFLKDGFEAGQTYELSYQAQGSVVAGLGLAALRDVAEAFKHEPGALVTARYEYVFGQSQTGRFLRDFLYEGFNADEKGRRAFDGVMVHIAGAARGDFNMRFSQTNGIAYFTASLFPFLDLNQRDPATGKTDGLLSHLNPDMLPKIFYTNGSCEYWGGGRAAALIHTTLDGKQDAQISPSVRIYMLAGTQHIPGAFPPQPGQGQQRGNPNDYTWLLRAELVAMDRWVREGVQPPASRYPRLSDGTLVPQQTFNFPSLPSLHSPRAIPGGYRADLAGPSSAPRLPYLVPQIDADGNELGGIRLPEIAVPLATYTGWNFRNPSIGSPDELLPLSGSYIPFPLTQAAREENHDPRKSIAERYSSRTAYLAQVTDAASKLIQDRYLLKDDLAAIVSHAGEEWDYATAQH